MRKAGCYDTIRNYESLYSYCKVFPQLVGSGTSAFILARELQLRGHSVTVLTDASLRGNPEHKSLAFDVRYINDFEAFATGKAGCGIFF